MFTDWNRAALNTVHGCTAIRWSIGCACKHNTSDLSLVFGDGRIIQVSGPVHVVVLELVSPRILRDRTRRKRLRQSRDPLY